MLTETNKINIAVVGSGYWGRNLVRNFHEIGNLSTVCDIDDGNLSAVQSKYRGVKTTKDISDVLRDSDINGVVIAAPAVMHYELARMALAIGKDVFVEKPLALNTSEGAELVKLAEQNGRILMVGHILNYHPAINALAGLISKGALGKIRYIYSNRLNFGKIRLEENVLWSFAPHDISVILRLVGAEPKEVSARGVNYLHSEIADVTVSQFRFPDGVNAHIFVSWLHPFKEQKLVVVGEKQMAVFDDMAAWGNKLVLYPHEIIQANGIPTAKKADGSSVPLEECEPLRAECLHFIDCIKTRSKPLTDGAEGLRVLKILSALQSSIDKNGTAIPLLCKEGGGGGRYDSPFTGE